MGGRAVEKGGGESGYAEQPRQRMDECPAVFELEGEGGLAVGGVDVFFPQGDERAVGEAEQAEERDGHEQGRNVFGGDHGGGEGAADGEDGGDDDFLGDTQRVMPVHQLMGK